MKCFCVHRTPNVIIINLGRNGSWNGRQISWWKTHVTTVVVYLNGRTTSPRIAVFTRAKNRTLVNSALQHLVTMARRIGMFWQNIKRNSTLQNVNFLSSLTGCQRNERNDGETTASYSTERKRNYEQNNVPSGEHCYKPIV